VRYGVAIDLPGLKKREVTMDSVFAGIQHHPILSLVALWMIGNVGVAAFYGLIYWRKRNDPGNVYVMTFWRWNVYALVADKASKRRPLIVVRRA